MIKRIGSHSSFKHPKCWGLYTIINKECACCDYKESCHKRMRTKISKPFIQKKHVLQSINSIISCIQMDKVYKYNMKRAEVIYAMRRIYQYVDNMLEIGKNADFYYEYDINIGD